MSMLLWTGVTSTSGRVWMAKQRPRMSRTVKIIRTFRPAGETETFSRLPPSSAPVGTTILPLETTGSDTNAVTLSPAIANDATPFDICASIAVPAGSRTGFAVVGGSSAESSPAFPRYDHETYIAKAMSESAIANRVILRLQRVDEFIISQAVLIKQLS